jgi:hypothetical protein
MEFERFNNINFFIERKKEYAEYGRNESREEALMVDNKIKDYLDKQNIKYISIDGTTEGINTATEIIFKLLDLGELKYEVKEK